MTVEPTTSLVLAALAVTTLGGAVLVLVALATRPRTPRAGEATMDLGPEPPAIVDLLTDDYEVTEEAAAATLLDLAARRWMRVDEPAPGTVLVRLATRPGLGELLAHEQLLLDHVRDRAVDGVVQAEALTTGRADASARWWARFRTEVVQEARRRGLCRRRFPIWLRSLTTLATFGSAALLVFSADTAEGDVLSPTPLFVAAALATLLLGVASAVIVRSGGQRDTEQGREVAARWLGVRSFLADHGDFGRQPAAAVAVWDRYLAHAAALDLAPEAVHQLPLGAESDHHAWTASTGRWRHVRVRYPRLRPGWGRHPGLALLAGLLGAAASGAVVALGLWMARERDELPTGLGADAETATSAEPWLWRLGIALVVLALVPLAWFLVQAAFGVLDLFARKVVEGEVLRTRSRRRGLLPKVPKVFSDWKSDEPEPRWFVAVDHGDGDEVLAWRVRRDLYRQVEQRQRVRATVTPRLRHVRAVEVLERAPTPVVSRPQATVADLLGDQHQDPLAQALLEQARRLSGRDLGPTRF